MTAFPLLYILFWIALAVAPNDAAQITITSGNETWSWKHSPTGWVQISDSSDWSVSGKQVFKVVHGAVESHDVHQFVEGVQGNNWSNTPVLKLGPMKSLESTKDGFIYTVNRGDPTAKAYHITFIGQSAGT